MRKQNTIAISIIILIGIVAIFLENQNSITIEGKSDCSHIDSTLFRKLAILVKDNQFNRQYYEVIYFNHNKGCSSYVLNYNTKYQLLSLSSAPSSGFSGFYKLSNEELFKIANSNIKINYFYKFYKSDYSKDYGELPTRAFDLFFF